MNEKQLKMALRWAISTVNSNGLNQLQEAYIGLLSNFADTLSIAEREYPEPTYTQSQVEAIVKADRENLYLSMLRAKQMGSKSLWVASEFLILIRTIPIEIGEGE